MSGSSFSAQRGRPALLATFRRQGSYISSARRSLRTHALIAHVDGEAGFSPARITAGRDECRAAQAFDVALHLGAHLCRERFSVENARGHGARSLALQAFSG